MTNRIFRSVAALALAPLALPAHAEISAIDMAQALRAEGCRVEVANLQALTEAGGHPAQDVQSAMSVLFALGASTVADDGALWLEPAYCGLSGTQSAEDVLVAGLRLNGCRMTESQAEGLLGPMGLDRANTTPAVEALVGRGDAQLLDDVALTLGPALCAGADEIVGVAGPEAPPPATGDMVDTLVAIAAANGCEIDEETAETVFPQLGIEMNDAEGAAEAMIAAGQATFAEDVFTVLAPLCIVGSDGAAQPLESSDPVALRNPAWPAFLALFADHACAMAFEPATLVAGDYGLQLEDADELADQLMDAGLAEVGGDVLLLDPSVCTPSPASAINNLKLDLTMDMLMSDCTYSLIDLTGFISGSGRPGGEVQQMVRDMLSSDRLTRDGTSYRLNHPNCG